MIIGFTGTQSGMNKFQQTELLKLYDKFAPSELHHGDCIGADLEANDLFLQWHIKNDNRARKIVLHVPLDDKKQGNAGSIERVTRLPFAHELRICKFRVTCEMRMPAPYLERNRKIVDSVEMMIAATKEFEHTLRSGTWATIRYAWKVKRSIFIIPPIGD